jgi:hypothetical protein
MFGVGPENKVALCLDCYIKFQGAMYRNIENLQREQDFLVAQMEFVTGMPGLLPRHPPRPPRVVLQGGVTLNHIKISDNNIGVLNTGSIGSIDGAIGVMNDSGEAEAAKAIKTLTEAVAASAELTPAIKNKVMEGLSVVAAEGAAPKGRRRREAMRTLLKDVATCLSGSAALVKLYETATPFIERLFA